MYENTFLQSLTEVRHSIRKSPKSLHGMLPSNGELPV
jgi:hypothetical protein